MLLENVYEIYTCYLGYIHTSTEKLKLQYILLDSELYYSKCSRN